MSPSLYPWLVIGGIILSAVVWTLLLRRDPSRSDPRLALIYFAGLVGALVGAKLVYLAAEGWLPLTDAAQGSQDFWRRLATGKSILGALLGGYAAVEMAKRMTGYRQATGDLFAVAAPLGIALGRVGCLLHGCCQGKVCEAAWYTIRDVNGTARWPAVPIELGFNVIFFVFALVSTRRGRLQVQLFHVYLMAYGVFRLAHEVARETPRALGHLSGYQVTALAVFALGVVRYWQRARLNPTSPAAPSTAPARPPGG